MRRPPEDPAIVPFPTYPVSNMEWVPKPITRRQLAAERLIAEACDRQARRHGMTRAQFLRTAAATTTALLVLNQLHGSRAFAVTRKQCEDPDAARALLAKKYFVMDVQQHHVDLERYPTGLNCTLRFIERDLAGGCPEVVGQTNFIKEIFVDSETDVGVISGLPYGGIPLGPQAMLDTRDRVNALAGGERCLAQAVCDPAPEYQTATSATAIDKMEGQVRRGARALKCYTYSGNWRLDDERVAYPMLQEMQRLGLTLLNVHKGLPAIFAPGSEETVRATDFPKVVRDWPGINFCAYHSAWFGSGDHPEGKEGSSEFLSLVAAMPKKERRRVYAEIGSTFAIQITRGPDAAAHFIGQLLKVMGSRNILWGTDSIWWGSPQWLIDAFRCLQIPDEMQEQFGYPPLTDKAKARILGMNAARLYKVKPKKQPQQISGDQLAMLQTEQGGAHAGRGLVTYGPRTRREFLAMRRSERHA